MIGPLLVCANCCSARSARRTTATDEGQASRWHGRRCRKSRIAIRGAPSSHSAGTRCGYSSHAGARGTSARTSALHREQQPRSPRTGCSAGVERTRRTLQPPPVGLRPIARRSPQRDGSWRACRAEAARCGRPRTYVRVGREWERLASAGGFCRVTVSGYPSSLPRGAPTASPARWTAAGGKERRTVSKPSR